MIFEQYNPTLLQLDNSPSSDDDFEDYETATNTSSPSSSSSPCLGTYSEQRDHKNKLKSFQMKFTYLKEPRKRTRTTPEQLEVLLKSFEKDPVPSAKERKILAEKTGMTSRSVQVWFQNRRAKHRNQPLTAAAVVAAAAAAAASSSSSSAPSFSVISFPSSSSSSFTTTPATSAFTAPLSSVLPTLPLPAAPATPSTLPSSSSSAPRCSNSNTSCQFEYMPFQTFLRGHFQPEQLESFSPSSPPTSPSLSPSLSPSDDPFQEESSSVVPQFGDEGYDPTGFEIAYPLESTHALPIKGEFEDEGFLFGVPDFSGLLSY